MQEWMRECGKEVNKQKSWKKDYKIYVKFWYNLNKRWIVAQEKKRIIVKE